MGAAMGVEEMTFRSEGMDCVARVYRPDPRDWLPEGKRTLRRACRCASRHERGRLSAWRLETGSD